MPAKMIGAANWLIQPGFPALSGEEGNEQIHVQFIGDAGLMAAVLPEFGTAFYDFRWPFFNSFDKLVLNQRNVMLMPGQRTYIIDLIYSVPQEMEKYSYRSLGNNAPIEKHPNYRTNWNHCYIANENGGDGRDILTYWADAQDTVIPDSLQNYVQWIRPNYLLPKGWYYVDKKPQKRGVETFNYAIPEVTYRKMSVYKDDLESVAHLDNTIQTPGETFGKEGFEWLQGTSEINKEGRFWVLTVNYIGSKDVDEDIYDGSI